MDIIDIRYFEVIIQVLHPTLIKNLLCFNYNIFKKQIKHTDKLFHKFTQSKQQIYNIISAFSDIINNAMDWIVHFRIRNVMNDYVKKNFCFALFCCVIMLTVVLFTAVAAAENKEEKVAQISEIKSVPEENSYKNYKDSILEYPAVTNDIVINSIDCAEGSTVKPIECEIYGENGGIIFENSGDRAIYSFDNAADGIYNIKVNYAAIEETTMDIQMSVYIDGKTLWDNLNK